ncbi:UDP-glucose/GDP-mannose dehydrogenase family protein [Candidatus Nitronereus thalassa]|uniref:UDP-glucose 6-dehydrogenase n=1 Tax=Candidatus Nitronereus thalassa TaxID=3020898 RepID=A0ABU3K8K1_9BACT|nr:UDP-glucose/GDP-mannose dehydrogenase family protein [Candidatus Nitronereus thalassa]MDT7042720.1 UDP-glucose/GDP-mannose dehydrogenase family protein [Candidatus Nitronereus thalassa]
MHISVLGTGYVGLVTGACFAEFGLHVTCMDVDPTRIEKLENGEVPFYEPGLAELVAKGRKAGTLKFTTDLNAALDTALVIFIAVGTPSRPDGSADLSYVDEVARSIGSRMTGYKVVVTKSTVPVGTANRVRELIKTNQPSPINFDVASNPEFLREGSAIGDFMRPDRVVIGVDSDQAAAIMKDLYRPLYLLETPVVVTNVPTAEMIKYASNVFLATKISFINEVANLCEMVGGNVQTVAKAMGLDKRIGSKFLHAGPGYGGSCFGKDTAALVHIGEQAGYEMKLAATTKRVNEQQHGRMVDKIREALGGVQGKTIALLGLSFKPNTDDLRDSPALVIAEHLMKEGCKVRAHDPEGQKEAVKNFQGLIGCQDAYDAATGADAIVLATEWNQFRNLDLEQMKSLLKTPVLIDLRNVYEPERVAEQGFYYVSVGRPSAGANPFKKS